MKASDLQLGDVVSFGFDGYSTGTVKQIDDKQVHITRPYVHVGDCIYAGNQVSTYLGTEEIRVSLSDTRDTMKLLERRNPEATHKAVQLIKANIYAAIQHRDLDAIARLIRQI